MLKKRNGKIGISSNAYKKYFNILFVFSYTLLKNSTKLPATISNSAHNELTISNLRGYRK